MANTEGVSSEAVSSGMVGSGVADAGKTSAGRTIAGIAGGDAAFDAAVCGGTACLTGAAPSTSAKAIAAAGSPELAVGTAAGVAPSGIRIVCEIICGIIAIMGSDFCRSRRTIRATGYNLFTGQAHSGENPLQLEVPVQLSQVPSVATATTTTTTAALDRRAVLMDKAKALEAAFLSEMLSYAGVDASEGEFSGGIGEDQYASFLRDTQARAIVDHGGIGLAEKLFQSLIRHDHAPE